MNAPLNAHTPSHTPARQGAYVCSLMIPTKNAGELFKRVIAGLQGQTCWKDVEFIVVDSGSTDETLAIAKAAGAKCVSNFQTSPVQSTPCADGLTCINGGTCTMACNDHADCAARSPKLGTCNTTWFGPTKWFSGQ